MALTVAVTGPTWEIGTSVVRALEQECRVDHLLGMARRPFDPASRDWRTTEYRQGDVLDVATAVCAAVVGTGPPGAHNRELGWAPAHPAQETLTAMVDAERDRAAL
jgi:hypothetical protein